MTNKKIKFILGVKTSGCSYCEAAKRFLDSQGFEYEALNVQDKDQYEQIHDLFLKTNQNMMRTVPMIFAVSEEGAKIDLVGGFDDLQEVWEDLVLESVEEFTNVKK
jgi:glutaredoxin